MSDKSKPKLKASKKPQDWTKITFKPDFAKFGMEGFDDDIVSLLQKRVSTFCFVGHLLSFHQNCAL